MFYWPVLALVCGWLGADIADSNSMRDSGGSSGIYSSSVSSDNPCPSVNIYIARPIDICTVCE